MEIEQLSQEQSNIENELLDSKSKWDCSKRNIIISWIFVWFVATLLTLFFIFNSEIKDLADEYVEFMKDQPVLATFAFMSVYILTRPFWIPATVFILFGAYIYGNAFGLAVGFIVFSLIDFVCLMVGTYLSFLNGRYLFRSCIQTYTQTKLKLQALNEALSHNAKKLVFLLRLCSLTPYYVFNYVCGVTTMSSKDYIIGNTSIILSNAPFIYVCASLNDISKVEDSSDNLGVWYYVIIGTSILIVIIVIIVVYYLAKRELRKTLAEIQQRKARFRK